MNSRELSSTSNWSNYRDHGAPKAAHSRRGSQPRNGSFAEGEDANFLNSPFFSLPFAHNSGISTPTTNSISAHFVRPSRRDRRLANRTGLCFEQLQQNQGVQSLQANNLSNAAQVAQFNFKKDDQTGLSESTEARASQNIQVSIRKKITDLMTTHCSKLQASYNYRNDDSIFAKGFERHSVLDNDDEVQNNAALSLDLSNPSAVAYAMHALEKAENDTILECNTFMQMVFLKALTSLPTTEMKDLLTNLGEVTRKFDPQMVIHPLNIKKVLGVRESHLEFRDFMDFILGEKKNPDELPDDRALEVGDILYVENYDNYPEEGNGNYAGEWCLVTDNSDPDDPKLYGFGVGEVHYSALVDLLKDAYFEEVTQLKAAANQTDKALKASKKKRAGNEQAGPSRVDNQPQGTIGIIDCFRLKREIFGEA